MEAFSEETCEPPRWLVSQWPAVGICVDSTTQRVDHRHADWSPNGTASPGVAGGVAIARRRAKRIERDRDEWWVIVLFELNYPQTESPVMTDFTAHW